MITPERLAHLREQKEATLAALGREYIGLMQAVAQNQARQQALAGQLQLLDELQVSPPAPAPPGPSQSHADLPDDGPEA